MLVELSWAAAADADAAALWEEDDQAGQKLVQHSRRAVSLEQQGWLRSRWTSSAGPHHQALLPQLGSSLGFLQLPQGRPPIGLQLSPLLPGLPSQPPLLAFQLASGCLRPAVPGR